ncbi:MAG: ABC transporter ATP-binding protein [Christensenellaceae bacterium]
MENIIEINNLNKSFGAIKAVQDISFVVKKGELFAFLGVNGAGKSTTISIMCGQLMQDSGSVLICGENTATDFSDISRKIGVVFQSSLLDATLTVKDNLRYRAGLYGITGKQFEQKLCELDELLNVKELFNRTLGKLSGGQRRRADIARALIHSPEILILDEPTTGLDPQTRKMLWNAVSKLRKERGLTVFLTTHYMEEAADADYVIILDSGKIVAKGTPLELKNTYTGDYITMYDTTESELEILGLPYEKAGGAYRISVPDTKTATELILKHPDCFKDYEITKGKMDDVFLAVTGKKLVGGDL